MVHPTCSAKWLLKMQNSRLHPRGGWTRFRVRPKNMHLNQAMEVILWQVIQNHALRSIGPEDKGKMPWEGTQVPSKSGPCHPTSLFPYQFPTSSTTYMTTHSTPMAQSPSHPVPWLTSHSLPLSSNLSFLRGPMLTAHTCQSPHH